MDLLGEPGDEAPRQVSRGRAPGEPLLGEGLQGLAVGGGEGQAGVVEAEPGVRLGPADFQAGGCR